jgi:hypothetical protein
MKDRRSFKLKSLMIFVSLCFITAIIQAQVLTGSNLDFNTGDYSGWVAKEGTYGGTSTAAVWNWSTTYNDPTQQQMQVDIYLKYIVTLMLLIQEQIMY